MKARDFILKNKRLKKLVIRTTRNSVVMQYRRNDVGNKSEEKRRKS